MRGCSNRQNPRPGRGRSRTYVSSRSMDIDTWSFGRFRSLARAVFPFSLVPVVPIDAEVRRWETRGTQACGFEGKLAWVVTQGAAVDLPPLTAAPSLFAGLLDRWVASRRSWEHGE
jgi:hypothetical protein